ncbi:Uncharacterized protein dnm_077430 [Desulfonema magnum]|uniref:Uncharacterized protein n=1 Tax=Desulfonema magnum TaxID=45655 RepID=A0A975BTU3_9BACT|nr:Uncharacterized protein dnm_077430 [Desulfonema magnum]
MFLIENPCSKGSLYNFLRGNPKNLIIDYAGTKNLIIEYIIKKLTLIIFFSEPVSDFHLNTE